MFLMVADKITVVFSGQPKWWFIIAVFEVLVEGNLVMVCTGRNILIHSIAVVLCI